jgi:hypothetical protein
LDKTIESLRELSKFYADKSRHRNLDNPGAFKKSNAQKGFKASHKEEERDNYIIDISEVKGQFIVTQKNSDEPPYRVDIVPQDSRLCPPGTCQIRHDVQNLVIYLRILNN